MKVHVNLLLNIIILIMQIFTRGALLHKAITLRGVSSPPDMVKSKNHIFNVKRSECFAASGSLS